MALNTVSSDRLSTNVKNTNFTSAEKQDLTDDIKPLLGSSGGGSKNKIINGAMQVAQRATSETGLAANGYSTVDRFAMYQSGTDAYPSTAQADVASGTTPYTSGFRKSFKITNGNQTSGGQAADQLYISHKIEAQDMATSGWNYTSASSYVTLSFWIKSSVAQNFYAYLKVNDGTTQNYPFETGALTADTWTKITKTIPGNSNLQFDTDTETNRVAAGVEFVVGLFFGTDHTGTITLNQWGAWSSTNRLPDYGTANDDWYETNGATFELTGVQLEVGNVATEFDHRTYGQELQLCGRYYQRISGSNGTAIDMAFNYNTTLVDWVLQFPMGPMRAVPSFDQVNGNDYFQYQGGGNAVNHLDGAFVIEQGTTTQANVYFDPENNLTAGVPGYILVDNSAAYLALSAEL